MQNQTSGSDSKAGTAINSSNEKEVNLYTARTVYKTVKDGVVSNFNEAGFLNHLTMSRNGKVTGVMQERRFDAVVEFRLLNPENMAVIKEFTMFKQEDIVICAGAGSTVDDDFFPILITWEIFPDNDIKKYKFSLGVLYGEASPNNIASIENAVQAAEDDYNYLIATKLKQMRVKYEIVDELNALHSRLINWGLGGSEIAAKIKGFADSYSVDRVVEINDLYDELHTLIGQERWESYFWHINK